LFNLEGFPRDRHSDWSDLPQLIQNWLKLNERMHQRLRVPLRHLNRAQRRSDIVDAAIDFGVAIDSLFLAEREPDRGELGLTLRLRAARLLGSTLDERRSIAKYFSTAYGIRSSAVHAGVVSDKIEGMAARKFLTVGYQYSARAVQMLIEQGEPDWSQLLLG
jgi:hypothetical protein